MDKLHVSRIVGVDTGALPNGPWNVRNFGWSPLSEGPTSKGTVAERTGAETAAVVRFMNGGLLGK